MGLGRAKNRAKDAHMKFLRMWAVPGLCAGIPCRAAGEVARGSYAMLLHNKKQAAGRDVRRPAGRTFCIQPVLRQELALPSVCLARRYPNNRPRFSLKGG